MHFSLSSSSSYLSLRLGSCVGSLCCISLVFFYARNSIATLLELQPGVGVGGGEGEERLDTARAKLCYYAADSKFYYHTVIISS